MYKKKKGSDKCAAWKISNWSPFFEAIYHYLKRSEWKLFCKHDQQTKHIMINVSLNVTIIF